MSQASDAGGADLPPAPPPEAPSRTFAWYEVWIKMLTRPSVQSYQALLRDPNATPGRAYIWVFVSSTVFYAVYMMGTSAHPIPDSTLSSSAFFLFLPFAGPVTILILIAATRIHQWVAHLLGGEGPFSQVVYLYGALIAPIQVLDITTAFTPYPLNIGIASLLGVYALVLASIALEAINGFGWRRAIITALWWAPLIGLFILIIFTIDSDVFQHIMDSLIPPTP